MSNFEQIIQPIIHLLPKLREDFEFLTEKVMNKSMLYANKQLQDTLMNYFLENGVSIILKKHMGKSSNRAVREELNQNMPINTKKYIGLLLNYEKKIEFYKLEIEYEKLLMDLILDQKEFDKFHENFKTQTRKRMLSVMLYIHWKLKDERDQLSTFFDLWRKVFPDNPLPEGIKRKRNNNKKRKLEHIEFSQENSNNINNNEKLPNEKKKKKRKQQKKYLTFQNQEILPIIPKIDEENQFKINTNQGLTVQNNEINQLFQISNYQQNIINQQSGMLPTLQNLFQYPFFPTQMYPNQNRIYLYPPNFLYMNPINYIPMNYCMTASKENYNPTSF